MHRRRRWLLFVVFAAVCAVTTTATRGYMLDDALITLRYARHFAASGHATWNPPASEVPLLGYTSVAWMAVESLIAWVVRDPDMLIIGVKLAAFAALALIAWLFADRLARGRAPMSACVVFGLLLFANVGHGLHANSGMETLLFAAVALFVIWSRDRAHAPLLGYTGAALGLLVRPEGLLIAPVLAWRDWRAGRKTAVLAGCGLVGLTVIIVVSILIFIYGSTIPSAASIKIGAPYPKRFGVLAVAFFAMLCAPAFLGACLLCARRGHPTSVLALAMAGALLVFLLFVRPVMNEGFRYQWPTLYWLAFGAIPAVEDPTIVHASLRHAMLAATVCLNVRTSFIALDCVWLQHDSDYDRDIGLALGHAMRPGEWLAVVDAGTVPYYADVPTHDAEGLADGTAERLPAPYPYAVFCRRDVAVVTVGVGDDDDELPRVLAECGFHQRFDVPIRRCGEHWFAKVVFARDGVALNRADLSSRRDFPEWCPSVLPDYVGLGSWKTWLLWDGRRS